MLLKDQTAATCGTPVDGAAIRELFTKQIKECLIRFPRLLDIRLQSGLDRLIANSSKDFVATRSFPHLRTLLLVQFFLQKKIENALKTESSLNKHLFLKVFRCSSRICVMVAFHNSYHFHREQILKTIHMILPGLHEIPRSFYLWLQPDLPYLLCYMEVYKLRGKELSITELREFENSLHQHLITIPPLTPALFWPYNEEESCRQLQLLQTEIRSPKDLPHVLIQFSKQTPEFLEFLIHFARPQPDEPMEKILKRLPVSLHTFSHFIYYRNSPFALENGSFSMKIPSCIFDLRESINLLYARRYVLKYLEEIIGPLRDYNGGLFEKQQQHFEIIRMHLGDKIRHFDIFAEKVFYAIHPIERRLSLNIAEAEDLFTAFSHLMNEKKSSVIYEVFENVKIVKTSGTPGPLNLDKIDTNIDTNVAKAILSLGEFQYYCLFCPRGQQMSSFLEESFFPKIKTKTLRLLLEEGPPLSLNPHHSYGDMRCRVLSKLLFEGLMRLNTEGQPELAGACCVNASLDGLIYTFNLRPSHWSNGEKVTAMDYVMSLQCALNDHISHPELLFVLKNARLFRAKEVSPENLGIRAINAETLQIELEWADPHFLHKLSKPFFFPMFGSIREPKWFNGPFLVCRQNNNGILLERNPYFWDMKRSYFDQIDIRWLDDIEIIYSLFKQGKIDWIGDPLSTLPPQIIAELKNEGKLHKRNVSRQFLIVFNTKHPVLASPLIRHALSLCIDRVSVCKNIFPYCDPLPPLLYEREEANYLFDKGLKKLGLAKEQFPTLTFSFSHQTRREKLGEYLQSVWKDILGIDVELKKMEWNIFRNKLEKGRFEITCTIVEMPNENSLEFYERFEGLSSWNFSQWTHIAYREVISKAKQNLHCDTILFQAKKILSEEVPFTPLFTYTHLWTHPPNLDNYFIDNEGCIDFSQASFQNNLFT